MSFYKNKNKLTDEEVMSGLQKGRRGMQGLQEAHPQDCSNLLRWPAVPFQQMEGIELKKKKKSEYLFFELTLTTRGCGMHQMEGEWPDDIICEILEHLDFQSLFSCGQVCHQWKTLTENEFFQRGKKDEKRSNFPSGEQPPHPPSSSSPFITFFATIFIHLIFICTSSSTKAPAIGLNPMQQEGHGASSDNTLPPLSLNALHSNSALLGNSPSQSQVLAGLQPTRQRQVHTGRPRQRREGLAAGGHLRLARVRRDHDRGRSQDHQKQDPRRRSQLRKGLLSCRVVSCRVVSCRVVSFFGGTPSHLPVRQALEEAAAAIEADPTNADAYHQRGFVKSFTGDISGTFEVSSVCVCRACRVACLLQAANVRTHQGEIEDFSKCIELKLRLNPFDAYNAYNNRGLAYQVTSTSRACTCVRSCVCVCVLCVCVWCVLHVCVCVRSGS
jgi:tetratricopeptide (TPR) repeat protein